MNEPLILVLFGPTASGKTAILERLFLNSGPARAEIISADSMQVYRGMDIGTAKPSPELRSKIPHHLIDIRNPDEQFNTGEFVRLAEDAIRAAQGRGALPVVSGGTGFYLKNLIQGMPESPPSSLAIRAALKDELQQKGAACLMAELQKNDPVSAVRIHINDQYRLLRALEVQRLTGKPLSSYAMTKNTQGENALGFNYLIIGLRLNRDELYARIDRRCSLMFARGLPDEVKRLYESGFTPEHPGLKAIGYKEFFTEDLSEVPDRGRPKYRLLSDLTGIEALIARNSRHYAKRQLTFFSSMQNVSWIDADNEEKAVESINRELTRNAEL